jgi:hypothetical protein
MIHIIIPDFSGKVKSFLDTGCELTVNSGEEAT